ncbi:MAG TPA: hypothetical protein VMU33_08970 [Burkholderiaceae bacterium]|nr:hypothetical protein [Burkholderiaceae bacterium]
MQAADLTSRSPTPAARWPASAFHAVTDGWAGEASVCATMWPTRSLLTRERWFDELYLWTEGFQATTMQRARIQLAAIDSAFRMLERERVERIGLTLSFGTVERCLDELASAFDSHPLVAHRVVVMLRGSMERLRSRYRLRAFSDMLRAVRIPVGYRISMPRISMELKALDFLEPDFAKMLVPSSTRIEYWQDFMLEARVAGIHPEWMIVAGLETTAQLELAQDVGIRFGQGHAVRAPYVPPMRAPAEMTADFA